MTDKTEVQTDEASELTTLRKHNTELTKDLKTLKATVETLKSERDTAKEAAENATTDELTRLKNQLTKAGKDILEAQKQAAEATKSLHSYKAETEIGKLLVSHKVQPDDAPMVTAYIKSLMSIDDEGNPSFDSQTAEAFGKSYFGGAGKRYTSAPDNSGGGSTGFDGTKAPRMTADNWNWTEFGKIQLENPAEAKAIAQAAGKNVE
ncbi:hypothetical protein [Sphingobium yanoikuyae]|uniref:hypothetical protein n=1 Tax=Sphingobium yanoikuyae TaxID=13690 RepID=UPI0028A6F374|nr:hypothetical protein [Sphingobium yanoikuyae]